MTRSTLAVTLWSAIAILPAHRLPEISTVQDGQTVERQLTRGDDHQYRIRLKAGDSIHILVVQRGVDLAIETRDSVGNVIADVDDEARPYGDEHVDLVAAVSGSYTIAIAASPVALRTGSYAISFGHRHQATAEERLMQDSHRWQTTATHLESSGQSLEARRALERALTLAERARGPRDVSVAIVLSRLAENALEGRDDERGRSLLERAIAIDEQAWGAEHPSTAMARARLAAIDQRAGNGPQAETAIRQALAVLARTIGTEHVWYVRALTTQAILRVAAHDVEQAETLDSEAAATLERLQNTNTIQYAVALHNLAEVFMSRHQDARAEELFHRSLAVTEAIEGPDSYRVSTKLQDLAILSKEAGNYTQALDYDVRALTIRERLLGADHADIAPLLNNMSTLYHLTGDDRQALALSQRALEIRRRTVGPYHTGTLNALSNIARSYAALGRMDEAIEYEGQAAAIVETQLALNLAVGSERQKLAFVRGNTGRTDQTISLHLLGAPGNADAARLAARVVLQRKGRVQDAMTDMFEAVRRHAVDPDDRQLFDELKATTSALAGVALKADGSPQAERRTSVATLEARKEQLETMLSEHIAQFRADTQTVTVEAVQAAIPESAALIEYMIFRPLDPRTADSGVSAGSHYAAYVIRPHESPTGIDLGDAGVIDHAVEAFRTAVRDPRSSNVKARGHQLYELVMAPLRASLAGVDRLIVSPDGALNLAPFEALVDRRDAYLIEPYTISYVTSGRDLLRMQIPREAETAPVIVADPAFGGGLNQDEGALAPFSSLAATGLEARAVKNFFPTATLLVGADATKAQLEQIKSPMILHIASHGFFLADATSHAPESSVTSPLVRSGLALSSVNGSETATTNGILTALEASGLDLWGTKLVTLSACDTGVGEIRSGEGVYGLRRAFVLAGAETVVMNLWPVSDYVARDLVVTYYAGLHVGLGRSDALRNAKLAIMKRRNHQHPYFWASLIASGEWANLDGVR